MKLLLILSFVFSGIYEINTFSETNFYIDNDWKILKLKINQNSNTPSKIEFTIDNDNTKVNLIITNINNFMVRRLHLNSPDINGETNWEVNRQNGNRVVGIYLNKGKYSYTIEGGTTKPKYKYEMNVQIKVK